MHHENRVINKTLYVALGINWRGHKEVLGLWLAETEGAKFWLSVLTTLQNRGLKAPDYPYLFIFYNQSFMMI